MATNDLQTLKSPFKFLDAFTLEDRDSFFGRDKEVATLYDFVNKNRLVLVYGQSGTGKTSLIQCGLAGRFDITDWYPIFIRRQSDVNESLVQVLQKYSKKATKDNIVERVEKLNARFLRPIYLIFDQLEELLILGDEEEQAQFIQIIKDILEADNLSCHIIFIIREEYIAQLYHFEQEIPNLFDRRLRIEPMNFAKVSEVVGKSCDTFNIKLEKPEHNIPQIIDNISAGKSGIALPYLQVYLDMLYREDLVRTYGENPVFKESYPELEFTTKEIEDFGKIEDVLDKFIKEQERNLQVFLENTHPDIPEKVIPKILDTFVSEEGTKRPIRFNRNEDNKLLEIEEDVAKLLPVLSPIALSDCLEALEKSRLLRFADDSIELAHDSLAALIDKNRSDEQRQLNELRKMIQNAYKTHLDYGGFLSVAQYYGLKDFIPLLNLPEEQKAFIEASRKHNEAEERAEKQRLEKELATQKALAKQQEDNLSQQKKANQRQRMLTAFMVLVAIVAIGIGVFANQQRNIALEKEIAALEAQKKALVNEKRAETAYEDARRASAIAQKNEALAKEQEAIAKERELQAIQALEDQRKAQLQAALAQAETLKGNQNYEAALKSYQEALKLAKGLERPAIQKAFSQCEQEQLEFEFNRIRNKGIRLAEANECLAAIRYLEQALSIKPDDEVLKATLIKCEK